MPLPSAVPAPANLRYRSPAGLGSALQVLIVVLALLAAMSLAAEWVRFVLVDRLINDPTSVTSADLDAGDDRVLALLIASLVVDLAVIVVFIIWTHRLYRNVPVLGFQPRFTSGWAIGAWFVPILNLWRPKQIIDDIWRGSAPLPEVRRRDAPVSPLLHVWWAAFLLSGFLRNAANADASSPEGIRTAVTWSMVSHLVWVIASVLAFWVVSRVTQRQIDAATASTALGHVAAPSSPAEPRRSAPVWLKVAALPTAVVLVTAAMAAVWAGTTSSSNSDDATRDDARGTMHDGLRKGDCFELPEDTSSVLAVDVVPCDSPHDAEVVGFAEVPADISYPGDEEVPSVGAGVCAKTFETYVGASWFESGLDLYTMGPNESEWQSGDRDYTCAAGSLDGEPLGHRVQGVGTVLAPNEAALWSLDEGDCFNDPTPAYSQVVELQRCEDPHNNEVLAVVEHPDSATGYPGDDALIEFAIETCADALLTRVDPSNRSGLDHTWWRPVSFTWETGHHSVACAIWDEDGDPLVGSMQAGRAVTTSPAED